MLSRLEWMSLLTRQVSEALERIDNGTYGLCLRCGQPIAVKRLAALPWVSFCTTCQEEQAEIRIV
jgi:DnaK suppressor protein